MTKIRGIFLLETWVVLVWLAGIYLCLLFAPLLAQARTALARISESPDAGDLLISFTIAIVIFAFLHKQKYFGLIISVVLAYMIFGGATLFFGETLAFLLAVGLVLYQPGSHSFLSNNLLVSFGVLFGAFPVALEFSMDFVIFILLAFSVYDVVGVFLTNFIPNLAARAVESRIPLLLFAPRPKADWRDEPGAQSVAAMVGAGDLFLPLILLITLTTTQGFPAALIVLLGAVCGWGMNTILSAMIQGGIPAMPMLTVGMLIAYHFVK